MKVIILRDHFSLQKPFVQDNLSGRQHFDYLFDDSGWKGTDSTRRRFEAMDLEGGIRTLCKLLEPLMAVATGNQSEYPLNEEKRS